MKRSFLILIAIAILITSVSANTALNFQQPADFTAQINCIGTGTCIWYESTTGGNNYMQQSSGNPRIINTVAQPMTYAAITHLSGSCCGPVLYDSGMTLQWQDGTCGDSLGRGEVKVIGGTAYFYWNGVLKTSSGALAQNPSYIGWWLASDSVDDAVWGSSAPLDSNASDKYVYGMPETQTNGTPYYIIMKDFINPAASGFYTGGGALLNSHHFTSTFSKGNNNNDTIYLQGYTTGVNVLSNSTGSAYTGTISWDLDTFFASNPNYGLYAMHSTSSLKYSDLISYIGNGATISWNQPTYAQGDTGAIITVVASGGYWNPALYDYRVDVLDVFGAVQASYPVTTQTQTISHTWATDQAIGVYYAVIIAKPKTAGSSDIWMNYAICDVNAYLTITGYVKNGETASVISGASVNISQGVDTNDVITSASGNYSISGLAQGANLAIDVGAAGYENYTDNFLPLRVGTLQLNFTLLPTSHTYSGIAIGGIVRTTPYNQTVDSATVHIGNTTAPGGNYTVTTNGAGYYIQNYLPNNYWWEIWGSKPPGFSNSTIYKLLAVGI